MNKKRRKVLLLAAGATLDWCQAPSTKLITQKITEIGFRNKQGEWITKCIFDKLNNGKEPDYQRVNFETIINVIEDFIVFWSKNDSNLLSHFIPQDHIDWDNYIGNYKISKGNKTYNLIIEGESEAVTSRSESIPNNKPCQVVYFEILLMKIFDFIISEIDKYSNTYKNKGIYKKDNKNINDAFVNYFKKSKEEIIRIYSTNYDKIIETLLKDQNIDFTDGFQDLPVDFPPHIRHMVPHAIYLNENRNCIYHLHGSAYWKVVDQDENGLDYYNFVSGIYPEFSFNSGIPSFSIEKSNSIPIFNIITGYRKVLRTGLSPFRQFFSAFDRDCYKADELTIVGYSFGDEHINDIINKARYSNKNLKINIIDPCFNFDSFSTYFIPKWGHLNFILDHIKIDKKTTKYKQIGLTVYKMSFFEYLKR